MDRRSESRFLLSHDLEVATTFFQYCDAFLTEMEYWLEGGVYFSAPPLTRG